MKYTKKFIDQLKKEVKTPTVQADIGIKKGFNVAFVTFEKEWSLKDISEVLIGIKKSNLKINIFIHIFKGSQFPKLSEINNEDLSLDIYNNAFSIIIGLKKPEFFMAQAARDLTASKNMLLHCKSLEESVKLMDKLIIWLNKAEGIRL